jgi:hypothetical protein
MNNQQGRKGAKERGRKVKLSPASPAPLPPCFLIKVDNLKLVKLKLSLKSLISLIILLTTPVDKSVDKLWISCG